MLGGMHHISIAVDDLKVARAFYGGVLGLAEIPRPLSPTPADGSRRGGASST